jgi:hypothetical protein
MEARTGEGLEVIAPQQHQAHEGNHGGSAFTTISPHAFTTISPHAWWPDPWMSTVAARL